MHPHFGPVANDPHSLTFSPVETCFHKTHMNLYGVFILGVSINIDSIKYGLLFVSLGSKVAYTSANACIPILALWLMIHII